jgi:hypothetical protein
MQAPVEHPELHARFIEAWGEPLTERRVTSPDSSQTFFALWFPGRPAVSRFVTCGLARCRAEDGSPLGLELLMVVGHPEVEDLGPARIEDYLFDLAAHLLRYSARPTAGSVMPDSTLAPWEMPAIIFDDARGEPEDLERYHADGTDARLLWAIPAFADEAQLVRDDGIDAFDRLVSASDLSLADVRRHRVLPEPEGNA